MNQIPTSLMENVTHGTQKRPMLAISFKSGPKTAYPDHFFVARHWHENIEMIKIIEGTYLIEINLEEIRLNPGDLCILNSGALHQLTGLESVTRHHVFLFNPAILNFDYPDLMETQLIIPWKNQELTFPHLIRKNAEHYELFNDYISRLIALFFQQEEGWYFRCKLLLLEFLYTLMSKNLLLGENHQPGAAEKERIHRYKKIVSYMEGHYDQKLTLTELATQACCSPQYLCRFFKNICGCSPIDYLIQIRLKQAQKLLIQTTASILDISLSCGFDNVSYFIRKFRQYTGKTPGTYRKDQKNHNLFID